MKIYIIKLAALCFRFIRGEVSTERLIKMGLKVGNRFSREGGVRIDTSSCHLISFGDDVTIAPNVTILAHDASLKKFLGVSRIGKVVIGNKVFIGANSVILPNCTIGNNVVIGAGSVVTKDIPSDSVYAGNPAEFVSSIDNFIGKNISLMASRPTLEQGYASFNLEETKKDEMRELTKDGYVFMKCENWKMINETSTNC